MAKISVLVNSTWQHYNNVEYSLPYDGAWLFIFKRKENKKIMIPRSSIIVAEVEE